MRGSWSGDKRAQTQLNPVKETLDQHYTSSDCFLPKDYESNWERTSMADIIVLNPQSFEKSAAPQQERSYNTETK
jgi:hypothetical protein